MTILDGERARADWGSALDRQGETIEIGRQTGATPAAWFWSPCRARVKGYRPDNLVGAVQQGEMIIKAFLPDLIEGHFPLPVRSTDKVKVRGAEKQINAVDNNTGRVGNTQVYVKISAVG